MAYVGEIRADCPLCSRSYKLGETRQGITAMRWHLMDFHKTSEHWASSAAHIAFSTTTTPREAP
jgi:hypothetical protein